MAGTTITARRTRYKLPLMNVLMAVTAEFMADSLAEIAIRMALKARDVTMFPRQRKLGPVMIEPCVGFE